MKKIHLVIVIFLDFRKDKIEEKVPVVSYLVLPSKQLWTRVQDYFSSHLLSFDQMHQLGYPLESPLDIFLNSSNAYIYIHPQFGQPFWEYRDERPSERKRKNVILNVNAKEFVPGNNNNDNSNKIKYECSTFEMLIASAPAVRRHSTPIRKAGNQVTTPAHTTGGRWSPFQYQSQCSGTRCTPSPCQSVFLAAAVPWQLTPSKAVHLQMSTCGPGYQIKGA